MNGGKGSSAVHLLCIKAGCIGIAGLAEIKRNWKRRVLKLTEVMLLLVTNFHQFIIFHHKTSVEVIKSWHNGVIYCLLNLQVHKNV